jgi:hypothetical protein
MQGYWNQLLAGARPDVRTEVVSTMGSLGKYAALSIIDATFSYDPMPALRRYPGPKLAVVTPGGDTPHDLHHLVPGLPQRRVEGTSHWLFMDAPEEFNRWLEEFFASID